MKKHEITLNNKSTYEAIGEYNSGNCRRIANDKGDVFTSIKDAAAYAGTSPQYMWNCLQPNTRRKCKGHLYFYVDNRDESFDVVMNRLAETTAEIERRKADEEDARKWREYQAEQERIRKAEEKRIADELKAKREHEARIEKARNKMMKYATICDNLEQKLKEAIQNRIEAEKEFEDLIGPHAEEDVA